MEERSAEPIPFALRSIEWGLLHVG